MEQGKQKYTRLENPWSKSPRSVTEKLDTDPENGLSEKEVQKRIERYGMNRLKEKRGRSALDIWVDQFKNLIVALLAGAALISFLFGQNLESAAIIVALLINVLIGFFTEWRAVRSMEALKKLTEVTARVRREGKLRSINSKDLVPGDLLVLEAGDLISADVRLLQQSNLYVDESALTGESVPVSKGEQPVNDDTSLAERSSMAFSGTSVTEGAGEGIVVYTGMDTELGKISRLTEAAEAEETPLEKRLERLGYRLLWLTLAISALVAVMGWVASKPLLLIVETAIALAVAAIPEGLPIVATIALARGMWKMANRNALMNQLSAVETLGSVQRVFTDKTGTLTENRMYLQTVTVPDATDGQPAPDPESEQAQDQKAARERLIEIGVLCNSASIEEDEIGDPMELALLRAGLEHSIRRKELIKKWPEEREESFDSDTMMMATFHETEPKQQGAQQGRYRVAVKGAPEAVLDACTRLDLSTGEEAFDDRRKEAWRKQAVEMGRSGLRVLAFAEKVVDDTQKHPYEELVFCGFGGLMDPPAEGVRESIETLKKAGIRTVMVTGDQKETAISIGKKLGIIDGQQQDLALSGQELQELYENQQVEGLQKVRDTAIFCRVTPEQKLRLVELYQEGGYVAAMTGDGVNDAPALKSARIGIAMGRRGTQVAREAAAMILKDDAFSTIPVAVEQGRAIFENIRRFILYLLSGNVSEILIVGIALVAGAPLPLLPLQILYLNMLSDVFPALALGLGPASTGLMNQPPRDPSEPVLNRFHWIQIFGYGIIIAASVLGGFYLAFYKGYSQEQAVTISFLSLAFARQWHVFNMRNHRSKFFRNEVTRNIYVWGALLLVTLLLIVAAYFPPLAMVLSMQPPGWEAWGIILMASLAPAVVIQVILKIQVQFDS